ncbi:MAG: hypothetical protein LC791_07375 [Acidobacteria bacterium]|nr:hypothetical protein [Acidobacteriota bacterium]
MKTRHDTASSSPPSGGALGDFAEELGAFLGNTERKASEWLNQRKMVADQLTAIRDKASTLLSQMGHAVSDRLPAKRRPGRPAGSKNQAAKAAPQGGRLKGSTISEETRRKMVEAARRRWARKGNRQSP